MDLSVLIVTHNSRAHIRACLASLEPALAGVSSEVVVIDNHSTDGTAEYVRTTFPDVRVVALDRNLGFAGGINAGLRASTGDVVIWMNPDAAWVSGRIKDVIDWMRAHPEAAIVGGKILDPAGTVQRSARSFPSYGAVLGARYSLLTRFLPNNPFSRKFLRSDLSYDAIVPVDWVSGAFLAHRREAARRLEGPDERFFMYFEDVDFCYRARQAGYEVYFHPGMTIAHEIGGSSSQRPAALLVARHHSLWRWYTKHFRRFWLKDAVIWIGIWIRCGALIVGGAMRGRRRHE